MKRLLTLAIMMSIAGALAPSIWAADAVYVRPRASKLVKFGAAEVRRYIYLRTGKLLDITNSMPHGDAIVIATKEWAGVSNTGPAPDATTIKGLGPQEYLIKSLTDGQRHIVYIIGGSDVAALYGAYRFAEHLGVRFYMHGDVIPDEQIPFALPSIDEKRKPLFDTRGIQPFHDFPEGPDWWTTEDYKAIVGQLPKMGMNFIGLHTYFGEPEVWIGLPKDVNPDGTVKTGYPAAWCMTTVTTGWGFSAKKTGDYALGAANLFDRDSYGPDVLRGFASVPQEPEDCVTVFNRTGAMFHDVFAWARKLGVKTCVGTETPLQPPASLKEKIGPSKDPAFDVVGGKIAQYSDPIKGSDDGPLYQNVRYDLKGYQFPLPDGAYRVTLKFCEVAYNAPGVRVFDVAINGKTVIAGLDIFAKAGKDKALDFVFDAIRLVNGRIAIDFIPKVEFPSIAAIAIEGPAATVKVNCGGPAYKDYRADYGLAPLDKAAVQKIYEGMFTRIAKAYPTDYYWLWTPEGWTWEGVKEDTVNAAVADIQTANAALKNIGAPFQLATCGWVLGPQYDRALFDRVLPKDVPMSCINRQVGHEPVERGFAEVKGRPKWAIPWLEDDPALTSPQIWAGRMRRDAADALAYGCTGLMGIHWRTRILGPNVSALAQAAWDQSSWPKAAPVQSRALDPKLVFWPVDDFYADWALTQFGPQVAKEAAAIFATIDCHLPRPSDWMGGPGGYAPDPRPWETARKDYAFVSEFDALKSKVQGAGNRERFDYWLDTFTYMRGTAEMRCAWAEYNKVLEQAKAAGTPEKKKQLSKEKVLPARKKLVAAVSVAYNALLKTVSSSSEMGTIANLEQHTFPEMLDKPGQELARLLGEPLPPDAVLSHLSAGICRLIVPTVRTAVVPGKPLNVKVILLDSRRVRDAELHWRRIGRGDFQAIPLTHVDRGVYNAAIPVTDADIEYYVEVKVEKAAALSDTLYWPPTAPKINQTVVVADL